jgi:acetyl-CoA carboxylase biotin carboxyl carrier protein
MASKKTGRQARPSAGASTEPGTHLDVEALRQIIDALEASEITRLVWRRGDEQLVIRRAPSAHGPYAPAPRAPVAVEVLSPPPARVVAAPAPAPSPAPQEDKPGTTVTSPFVGTFYRSPSPDQPAFVELGSVVRKGQTLCIIEAMKLMNEIESEVDGKVAEVLAENGQPVEYGQPLFRIEPL